MLLDGTDRYGSGKVGGIWIDHSGNAGAEFLALEGTTPHPPISLTPRVGDGLFAALDPGSPAAVAWVRQFEPMGEGSAPPDWLAAHAGTRLQVARNGRAYAVIHPPRLDAVCHTDIEVLAPSGKSCGTAVFPAEQSGPFCGGSPIVGDDGTVVQMVVTGSGSNRSFTFRWWPGFLR